eukprot:g29440.t1
MGHGPGGRARTSFAGPLSLPVFGAISPSPPITLPLLVFDGHLQCRHHQCCQVAHRPKPGSTLSLLRAYPTDDVATSPSGPKLTFTAASTNLRKLKEIDRNS